MKTFCTLVVALLLIGCARGFESTDREVVYLPTPTTLPASPTPIEQDISDLVSDENDYRISQGQTLLSNGLSCTVSTFTSGDSIKSTPDVGHTVLTGLVSRASFTYKGDFNQGNANVNLGLNVLPLSIRPLYLNLFLLRCTGYIVITETNWKSFELGSDDGSLLYIDGSLLVDNDNAHGLVTKAGSKALRRGVHSFRLDFAQSGGGNQALILKSGGTLVNSNVFFH